MPRQRNHQKSRPPSFTENGRKESGGSSNNRLREGLAYNPFREIYETPFPTVERSVREKAIGKTGHSIEQSYEDFLYSIMDGQTEYDRYIGFLRKCA